MDQDELSRKTGTALIRDNQLEFLLDMFNKGVPIGDKNIKLLREHGLLFDEPEPKKEEKNLLDKIQNRAVEFISDSHKKINAKIDIIAEENELSRLDVLTEEQYKESLVKGGFHYHGMDREITKEDWLPKSVTEHTEEFIQWIDSINNKGLKNRTKYANFELYCQQAYTWLGEKNVSYTDFEEEEDRMDFLIKELKRCDENSLYWLNKYVYYKDGDDESGRIKYVSAPVHEVMAFMNDSGYSFGIVKGRQIAATTTLMALDVKDMVFKTNYFMKFITEDVVKAEEIFEDKLKFCFSELPFWMKPNVLNERDNLFKLGNKPEKGTKEGVGSKIMVVAPKRTAIAGGAPQKVKIDEAGNISILSKMIDNARPTMLRHNPKTKKLELKRQLIFWGTGGEMEKGGKAFETVFLSLMKQWEDRDFSSATVPIFFDWTCRPGITQEIYDNEKRAAYSRQEQSAGDDKDAITEFHQSYPSSLSDVFRTSGKTLMSDEYIEQGLNRISEAKRKAEIEKKPPLIQYGFFEPIYDVNQPEKEGSDHPYKIIGADFIPTEDIDPRAAVQILQHPISGWTNRYFKGTDPIDTDTGLSNFASTVWDKWYKCPVAILDFRTRDYRQVFLQSMLLNIYYDTSINKKGIKELVESNRGTSYTQYMEEKGWGKNLVLNYELPQYLQNRTTVNEGVGLDTKNVRKTIVINRMHEMIQAYGHQFYFRTIFDQLKTFVCSITATGKESWGPVNRKYFKDDVLDATVFSYICSELCFPELTPKNLNKESNKYKHTYKIIYDKNYNQHKVFVKEKVK
jgi:hypothetical protein